VDLRAGLAGIQWLGEREIMVRPQRGGDYIDFCQALVDAKNIVAMACKVLTQPCQTWLKSPM
jgi:hypothetical protein